VNLVGFEALTTVTMKISVFWDITPYSQVEVSRCFRGTYRPHLQGRSVSLAINNMKQAESKALLAACTTILDMAGTFSRRSPQPVGYFSYRERCLCSLYTKVDILRFIIDIFQIYF
jgi:hypothetical protein